MAKPKKNIEIEIVHNTCLRVWCNQPSMVADEISAIEGVTESTYYGGPMKDLLVSIDPRYDIEEIIQEIKELLSSEVPDVFKD